MDTNAAKSGTTSMRRTIPRTEAVVAVAILSGFLAAGELAAQVPAKAKAKPTPITIPIAKPIAPQPIAKQPVNEGPMIDPRAALRPDLELALRPSSSRAAPSVFTVKNSGPGDAQYASMLRVRVRLLPLDEEGQYELARAMYLTRGWDHLEHRVGEFLDYPGVQANLEELFTLLCPLPYPDFQAAVKALDAGESYAVSKSGTRFGGGGVRAVGPAYVRTTTRVPDHSHVKRIEIEVQVVCAYELRAHVDANTEVLESNERNNEVVHVFQREVNY